MTEDKVAAEPAQGEAPTLRMQEASGAFDAQAKDFAAQVLANQGTVEAVIIYLFNIFYIIFLYII